MGVTLLGCVVNLEVDFEVSFAQASLNVTVSQLPVACNM